MIRRRPHSGYGYQPFSDPTRFYGVGGYRTDVYGGGVEVGIPLIYAKWDNTYSPIARYDFDGTVNDLSGNGRNLTLSGATDWVYAYGSIPGTFCLSYDQGSQTCTSTDAGFRLLGDFTIGVIWMPLVPWYPFTSTAITGGRYILSQGNGTSSTEANNWLFSLGISPKGQLQSFWEHGAGLQDLVFADVYPKSFEPTVIHYRRTIVAGVATCDFFFDGYLVGSQGGLSAPTGGTTTDFWLGSYKGSSGTKMVPCEYHQLKIMDTALTDAQIREEARAVSMTANPTV